MSKDKRLEILRNLRLVHLQENRPKFLLSLEENGQLESHLTEIAEETLRQVNELKEAGLNPDQAREMVLRQTIYQGEE